ncbi:MAG: TlpA disulfide reductase family protein [bacterium]
MPLNKFRSLLSILTVILLFTAIPAAQATGPVPGEKRLLLDTPSKLVAAFDVQIKTIAGKTYRLKDLKGQVVFLNFWATWCVPCLREMPSMERLKRKMKGKAFRMLAVNFDEPIERIRQFTKGKGFTFEIVLDPGGSIGEKYNAERLPLTYIIGRKGNIVRRAIGAREWDKALVVKMLEHMIGADAGESR